jgi:hypothetical protein
MQINLTPATARGLDDVLPHLLAGIDAGFASRAEARAVLDDILALLVPFADMPIWGSFWAVSMADDIARGLGGYRWPPGTDGFVEIGYSTFPKFEGRGVATVMVAALIGQARLRICWRRGGSRRGHRLALGALLRLAPGRGFAGSAAGDRHALASSAPDALSMAR